MASFFGSDKATEFVFQNDMIKQLLDNGWLLGKPENYNRELALYEENVLGFIKETQNEQWQKFLERLARAVGPRQRLIGFGAG